MSKISVKSFLSSILILIVLMILAYVVTLVVPSGQYEREIVDGSEMIVNGTYHLVDSSFPFYKFLLSPILVLTSSDSLTTIVIIVFLLIIGGIFEVLNSIGFIDYGIKRVAFKYKNRKYLLLVLIVIIFMLMGSFIGSCEEIVPIVPICILLCMNLGFDEYVGVGISTMAACCGFAAGIMNPFTVGTAQTIAGLDMFSGAWLRIFSFILIFLLFIMFLLGYAKKHEKQVENQINEIENNPRFNKAILAFVISIGACIGLIIVSSFVPALSQYAIIFVIVGFLVGGISSSIISKVSLKHFFSKFGSGVIAMLPAVLMILMAASIKYILAESLTLDSILNYFVGVTENTPKYLVVLVIYAIVLIFNFFIPSGSAKAFLLIPLIAPLASILGVSVQLAILAFAFGDGFSNVFYPTNPVLLITLNVNKIKYKDYIKFSWKFQLLNLLLTCGILMFGYFVGY